MTIYLKSEQSLDERIKEVGKKCNLIWDHEFLSGGFLRKKGKNVNFFQIVFLFLFGFSTLFSIGCSEGSKALPLKPNPENPDNSDPQFDIGSPGTSGNPFFTIRQLPGIDVTVFLFRGSDSNSTCHSADLIPLGDPISVEAFQSEVTIDNLGSLLSISGDGVYLFFVKIEGKNLARCFAVSYVLDTTAPRVVANPTSRTNLENDDIPVMSKNWNWACEDREYTTCTYRYKISPLTGDSCGSYTFASDEPYSDVFSATTEAGNDGKYCIHIQAKDEVGNESEVVSVYATLDGIGPTISSVVIPSKTYAGGDRINVTVTFSESITVTGTPRIGLIFDGGGQSETKYANYSRGSGSTELIFRYLVAETDNDSNGIGIKDNAVDLNSGSLGDAVGNSVSPLTFTAPSNLSSVLIDGDKANVILSKGDLSVDENEGIGAYTVRLSKVPSSNVVVILSVGNFNVAGLSTGGDSPSSSLNLTFETDDSNGKLWSDPQTVIVTGVNDDVDNDVGSRQGRSTTITHVVSSGDSNYDGLNASSLDVISLDDDVIGSIELTLNPGNVEESVGRRLIAVSAAFNESTSGGQASSDVVLPENLVLSTSVRSKTAREAEDFDTVSAFDITIYDGNRTGSGAFDLTVVDDEINENNETLSVSASNNFGLRVPPVALTINDNDEKGITVSVSSLSVIESGGTKTYTVKLDSEPTGPVTVSVRSSDTSVITVSPATLTFEADDNNGKLWSDPQTVTVLGLDDSSNVSNRRVTISHRVSGGGYTGISVDDVSVTNIDSRSRVSINNAANILIDNYQDYSLGGYCNSIGGDVSVKVGSMAEEDVDCTDGSWLFENINTSAGITNNGAVTITAKQTVSQNTITEEVEVQRCVSSGTGTSGGDPYWICNYSDLKDMLSVNTRRYFTLGMDIDASESWSEGEEDCGAYDGTDIHETNPCSGWVPLSTSFGRDPSNFDGHGHIVENLYINSDEKEVGLFGSSQFGIVNLHLRNVHIHSTARDSNGVYVGGLVGKSSRGAINNCSVTGTLSSAESSETSTVVIGGLVGTTVSDILNSYANVEINGGNNTTAGGLLGYINISTFKIVSSYSRGSVSVGSSGLAGGLVGRIQAIHMDVHSCYSHAGVSAGENGESRGLIGDTPTGFGVSINKSYALGRGSSDDPLFNPDNTSQTNYASRLFWDKDVSGIESSDVLNATGLGTADMQLACSSGETAGICGLGNGFSFSSGSYPKVKKCRSFCSINSLSFSDVLDGQ